VSGTGLGVVAKGASSSTPYIYAGVLYYVQAYGFDTWNNAQKGISTNFRFGSGVSLMILLLLSNAVHGLTHACLHSYIHDHA
jgi:hypothetical protein